MQERNFESHLYEEWHPSRNGELRLIEISLASHVKVWWLGKCGHEWEATVANRTCGSKTNCPYCAGKKVLAGFNDLATLVPEVAKLWHPTKNDDLNPQQFTKGSGKKIWWLGKCNHTWQRSIDSMTLKTSNCPYCSGKAVLPGFNDLTTTHPTIARELHPDKNGNIDPSTLIAGSHKKLWWLCDKGHEWETNIKHRCYAKSNCPYCAGQRVIQGINDILTTHPEAASKFHPTLNGPLKVTQVMYGKTSVKIWWQCDINPTHYWSAYAPDIARGQGCAVCANQQILIGVNDLATTNPVLASMWHPTKNGTLTPEHISAGSNRVIWWLCNKGHETETTVASRNSGVNCGFCTPVASKMEQKLQEFIKEKMNGTEVIFNTKKIIKPKELDIYIPSKKIAIEFNGLYWHSEKAGKDKDYHRNKWLACKDKGIQLIQVWEDEWNRNPEQIKRMLAHKLGVSNERKVFARKTTVAPISKAEVEVFLNENHVQGFASGSYYLGLKEKVSDELIAVLVLKKEAGTDGKVLNIIRYATGANVVGGFTKLLSFAEKTYQLESLITFADHCVSDGGLYENNGFIADKELLPDYMYISSNSRKHKFGYRLKRFQNDPDLRWEEGLTERQLAELNGLVRVWDAGKTRYRKTL